MGRIRTLLVDDEKAFVDILAERLEVRGFETHVVYSGAEAVNFLSNNTVDIVVLDVKMPGMEGIEVLKWIRGCCQELPVIMLTGYSSERDEKEARRIGIFDFLKKPPEIDVLTNTLKKAFIMKTQC
ncbi:MAG: response regulator [Candidatus Magnetoovum sp. WYHC-5]|nr:response regulator [Candidatus Magnetoovum sp. WYHC-5]